MESHSADAFENKSPVRLAVHYADSKAETSSGLRALVVGILGASVADNSDACSVESLPPFTEDEALAVVVQDESLELDQLVRAFAESGLLCERLDQQVEAHAEEDAAGHRPHDRQSDDSGSAEPTDDDSTRNAEA